MTQVADPERDGFVASLARPGGNITGLTHMNTELAGKRLELLKESVPKASRVAVLWNPANPSQAFNFKELETAAKALALTVQSLQVRTPNDFDRAFDAAVKGRVGSIFVSSDGMINSHRKRCGESSYQEPITGNIYGARMGGCRRTDGLWAEQRGSLSPRRDLRGQDFERRQAC